MNGYRLLKNPKSLLLTAALSLSTLLLGGWTGPGHIVDSALEESASVAEVQDVAIADPTGGFGDMSVADAAEQADSTATEAAKSAYTASHAYFATLAGGEDNSELHESALQNVAYFLGVSRDQRLIRELGATLKEREFLQAAQAHLTAELNLRAGYSIEQPERVAELKAAALDAYNAFVAEQADSTEALLVALGAETGDGLVLPDYTTDMQANATDTAEQDTEDEATYAERIAAKKRHSDLWRDWMVASMSLSEANDNAMMNPGEVEPEQLNALAKQVYDAFYAMLNNLCVWRNMKSQDVPAGWFFGGTVPADAPINFDVKIGDKAITIRPLFGLPVEQAA